MAEPLFTKPLQIPKKGEKVYELNAEEIHGIHGRRSIKWGLGPGMGGFSPLEIRDWVKAGAPLTSVDLMLTRGCNFKCEYCYVGELTPKEKLPFDKLTEIIDDCIQVGVKVFILTGGEPFVYRDNKRSPLDVIEMIHQKYGKAGRSVKVSMFTDMGMITPQIAQRLFDLQVALCTKRDSLDPSVQDKILCVPGGMSMMEKGYANLFDVGYGSKEGPPITVNSVFSRDTMNGMIPLHRWVRGHGMEHSIVPIHYCGNAENDPQQEGITSVHVKALYEIVSLIDELEFDDPWPVYSAFSVNRTCNRNISGVHIRSNGDVTACSESPSFNVDGSPIEDYVFGNVMNGDRLLDIARSKKLKNHRENFPQGYGDYICNPEVCDLSANDLCRGGCATRSAYSRIDPVTGLIVQNTDRKMYSHRREDPLCPGWTNLAIKQNALKQGLYAQTLRDLLEPARELLPRNMYDQLIKRLLDSPPQLRA